jgi:Rod binding domain-containing protein
MVAPLAMMGISAAGNVLSGVVDTINSALSGTKTATGTTQSSTGTDKAKKTADDFEKMFLETSLGEVTKNSGEDGPLGDNGTGGAVYRSMLMNQYAGQIVQSGGVGISSQIYNQMMKMQEVTSVGS